MVSIGAKDDHEKTTATRMRPRGLGMRPKTVGRVSENSTKNTTKLTTSHVAKKRGKYAIPRDQQILVKA